jgi:membrane protein YdbS with pleckstrin-like domain
VTFGETFAQSSVEGALTRGAAAWVLITPAVAAAKIWWSGAAAVVGVVGVVIYVAVAEGYRRQHRQRPRA